MFERLVPPTQFINCQVVVTPGEKPGTYDVITQPEVVTVGTPNTLISYQIVPDSPADIHFTGMSTKPVHSHQLSDPSISLDGKLLVFIDANTIKEDLNIVLKFKDDRGNEVLHDPQIINQPRV